MNRPSLAAAFCAALMAMSCGQRAGAPSLLVMPQEEIIERHGESRLDQGSLRYITRAGLLPIYNNDTGALMARMFFIAYIADRGDDERPRPLTFVWNGGPGANSSQMHLVGLGPRGVQMPPTYPDWKSQPTEIEDRPETWLTVSDLVFVDPIGTGYSRATSVENRNLLYTRHGDAEAVTEMIRVYRQRFDAFDQPLFIAGESYGTARAAEVAANMARRRTPLQGVVLISGDYDVGQDMPEPIQAAFAVPGYTAAAHFHRRLPTDLQALSRDEAVARATQWARDVYAPALHNPAALTASAQSAVVADLARYAGIAEGAVDAQTLALTGEFENALLEHANMEAGRYDRRMVLPRNAEWSVVRDPSIAPMVEMMQGHSPLLLRYLRNDLGYRSDLLYRGPFGESFHPQPYREFPGSGGVADDWMTIQWESDALASLPETQTPPQAPALRRAMEALPNLRVFIVHGMYDGWGSCAGEAEAVARSPEALRPRVRIGCYAAGHMVYSDAPVRRSLRDDFAQFIDAANAE